MTDNFLETLKDVSAKLGFVKPKSEEVYIGTASKPKESDFLEDLAWFNARHNPVRLLYQKGVVEGIRILHRNGFGPAPIEKFIMEGYGQKAGEYIARQYITEDGFMTEKGREVIKSNFLIK